jgi:tRNA nucleotidyltransferase (CCA-adding enzyme)
MVLQIEAEGECYDLKMLAIDGDFLVGMGIKPGKQIAVLLDNLLEMVIDGQVENTKDDLKSQLLSLIEIGSI